MAEKKTLPGKKNGAPPDDQKSGNGAPANIIIHPITPARLFNIGSGLWRYVSAKGEGARKEDYAPGKAYGMRPGHIVLVHLDLNVRMLAI